MGAELERQLADCDILLPRPRNYWIETNYSQYVHALHAADLEVTRAVMLERCPDYVSAFDAVMRRTKGHRFNMFVMKREKLSNFVAGQSQVIHEMKDNNGSSIATDAVERVARYRYAFRNEACTYRQEGIRGVCYYLAKCGLNLFRILVKGPDNRIR